MGTLRSSWLAVGLLAGALPTVRHGLPCAPEGWREARAELHARMAERVEDLARRCAGWNLFAQRDRLYEALIQLAPDHARARQRLGYQRTASGRWVRGLYRPGEDRSSEHLEEVGERRRALADDWREELDLLARRFDPGGEHLPAYMDDILILNPDDAEARAFRREERDASGAWVLRETLRARERRPALEDGLREIRGREVGFQPDAEDPGSPIAWDQAYEAEYGKLFACGDEDDALELLRIVETAGLVFEHAFGEVPDLSHEFSIYLLHDRRTRDAFLGGHPRVEGHLRSSSKEHAAILFDEGRALAVWVPPRHVSRDEVLGEVVDCMLVRSFRLGDQHAWARAGFGLRLFELVTGDAERTRELVPPERRERWRKNESPWERVRRLAALHELPPLTAVLGPCDGELGHRETLVAYAFARYLLEGWPEEAARLLDDLGRAGIPLERCLRDVLDVTPERLAWRLERWIAEAG